MTAERWLPVVGYEGLYEVSDAGRVVSLHYGKTRVMASNINSSGYVVTNLSLKGRARSASVHQVVLAAFVGPQPSGTVTRHLDGDRRNNTLANLTYGTFRENALDSVVHGTNAAAAKTQCVQGHPFSEENTRIRIHGERIHRRCRACSVKREVARTARRSAARALRRAA